MVYQETNVLQSVHKKGKNIFQYPVIHESKCCDNWKFYSVMTKKVTEDQSNNLLNKQTHGK